jgi:hypothetical protein
MNAAVRSFVRNCIYRGDTALGVHDGIEGLLAGNVSVIVCCRDFPDVGKLVNEFRHVVEFEDLSQPPHIKSSSSIHLPQRVL